MPAPFSARAFSLIGLLVTMLCMVVLGVILMSSLNNAMTGAGNPRAGTVRSFEDEMYLREIGRSLIVAAQSNRERLPTPADAAGARDGRLDTTANLWSLMIAQHSIQPKMLISGNEYNLLVRMDEDYDYAAYNPGAGVFWDRSFVADLGVESNASFAHMPLFGERCKRHWLKRTFASGMPLVGNRGPKDGRDDPLSSTYGRAGVWGGHALFGDGHVEFFESFTPPGLMYESQGRTFADNLYYFDDGPEGVDAMLTFTLEMTRDGPVVQHD